MPFLANLFGGIWARVVAVGAIVLGILVVLGTILRGAKKAGEDSVAADNLKRTNEIKDAQAKAALNRPNTDADLEKRLKDGTF